MKANKTDDEKIFRKLKPKEVVWIISAVILFLMLTIKSIYFDPFKPSTPAEVQSLEIARAFTEDHFDGFVYTYNVLDARIIKLQMEEETIKIIVRKYAFGFFPFGDDYFIVDN